MSAQQGGDETDKNIEMWKIKRVRFFGPLSSRFFLVRRRAP